jgi:hypothetical protein
MIGIGPLSAADFERARTWMLDIAETLLPGVRCRDEGGERRYLGQGGLIVNRRSGVWYSHAAKRGGHSAVALVKFLKQSGAEEAAVWVRAWLATHPGTGSCDGDAGDDDDGSPASAAEARRYLDISIDIVGSPAEDYLKSRRLDAPFPATGYIPYARCGEGGLTGILTSHDRIVGVQILYLDPEGKKSTVTPLRRRLMLETAPDAVFSMPYMGSSDDVVVCEGLEDALSVFRYGKRRCRIVGLPGIGVLRHLKFPRGTKVTVVCDGDAPGGPADKALHDGIDRLILDGVDVYVTATPPLGVDANDILQQAGVDGLVTFLNSAVPAALSLRGEVEKLARLDQLDYAQIRNVEAKRLGITVSILDREVQKVRDRIAAAAQAAQPDKDDWTDIEDTLVWPTPVVGAELLADLAQCAGEYVVMSDVQRWTVALWVLFTHCFAAANNAPKLWIKSAERRSGKTRLLELLNHLAARALATNYISAAMLPRVIDQYHPTLLMDEVDTFLSRSEEMRGVLNSGFDRDGYVIIGTKVGDNWVPRKFSAWCPQALAGIGGLPDTITDRSFCIELERKPRSKKVKRLRRRDTGPLDVLARKCARWAEDNVDGLEDAEPDMPGGLNDRAADAWELCVAIADCAGEEWGRRARNAALAISGDGVDAGSIGEQLLADIRDIFEEMVAVPKKDQRIASLDVVFKLNELIDRPWPEFRRGLPLTQATLARLLKPFHITPTQLRIGGEKTRGYMRTAFERAFERYLPPLEDISEDASSPTPSSDPDQTGTPVQGEEFRGVWADIEPVRGSDCPVSKRAENPNKTAECTGVPRSNGGYEREPGEIFGTEGAPLISTSPGRPNGSDGQAAPRSKKPLSQVEQHILRVWREHGEWSFRKIGRECSVTQKRAQRVITAALAEEASS